MGIRTITLVGGLLVGTLIISLEPGPGVGATPRQTAQVQDAAPGWSIDGRATGVRRIVWRSHSPLPMGNARFEFFAGAEALGVPEVSADRRSLTLTSPPGAAIDLRSLEVRAAGRRWDAPPGVDRQELAPDAASRQPVTIAPGRYDPGVPGPFTTLSGEYTLPAVDFPGFDAPLEMQAVVVAPAAAPGPRPVVLILHGRHPVCSGGTAATWTQWPCPAGTRPIPNYRGHLAEQQLLASQGFLTISISANSINAQDRAALDGGIQARSALIRHHLASWSRWADRGRADVPDIVRRVPAADLSHVLLMGHSRGADGVNRATLDSRTPPTTADGFDGKVTWRIRGTFLVTPTLLGHNPVPDVPSVVLLAGCDGDVYDQQGQLYADETREVTRQNALHSTVFVVGANHNYFNTEWTPGIGATPTWDDWSATRDPVCGTGTSTRRLSPAAQKAVGATYLAAAAHLFALGDKRVRPMLDGVGRRVASTGTAEIFTNAVGGAREPLVLLPPLSAAGPSIGATARVCAAVDVEPSARCLGPGDPGGSSHFARFLAVPKETGRSAVALQWSSAGQPMQLPLVRQASAQDADAVALRLIVPPNSRDISFDVTLRDNRGRRTTLGTVTLDGLPGTALTVAYEGQDVRVPLRRARAAGIDLRHIAGLEVVPRTDRGRAWVLDAWALRSTAAEPRQPALARADVSSLRSLEGDSGMRTHLIPVAISGGRQRDEPRQLWVYVVDRATRRVTERLVVVPRGSRRVEIPVQVPADTVHGPDVRIAVLAKGAKGLLVGNFLAELVVEDDDPLPSEPVTR